MRILIVRHADPEYHGDTLTAHGHKEAEALANFLTSEKEAGAGRISRIFSSPMGRARDTARYTEEASGIKAEVIEWTRELSYWPRMTLEWQGIQDAGKGAGKGGEGGLAVWDVPGEVVRAVPEISVGNEFDRIEPIACAKELYADLCKNSDEFCSKLGYLRKDDGSYYIVERNREVRNIF